MTSTHRFRIAAFGALIVGAIWPCAAIAQTSPRAEAAYPTKPIRFVLGFSAGGSSDILARLLGQKLSEAVGQPVVIDNRPGAGGNIAGELVAKSAADGYALLLGNQGILATNVTLYPKLAFDPVKDFAPVVLLASQPNVLVVHPSLPVRSVKELIALARKTPGALNYASSGSGAATHLAGELFKNMTSTSMTHVPYKGAPQALTDVISGQVQLMFASVTSVKQQIEAGRLQALAITDTKRSQALPKLPTVAESGVPGYEARAWHAVVAPAGTPQAAISRLNSELNRIMQLADVREKLSREGAEIIGGTPAELGDYIRAEIPKWAKVIKASGARAE